MARGDGLDDEQVVRVEVTVRGVFVTGGREWSVS